MKTRYKATETLSLSMTPQKPIGRPPHDRKLGLCGVSLTMARLPRDDMKAFRCVRDELEPLVIKSGYLDDAPFVWVTIAIRFGVKNEQEPHYQRINRKYGDLPLAIEVDTHELLGASLESMTRVLRRAVLIALVHAGHKYQRPVQPLEALLQSIQSDFVSSQSNVA